MASGLSGSLIYAPPSVLSCTTNGDSVVAPLVHAVLAVLVRCQDNYSNPLNSDEELAYDDR